MKINLYKKYYNQLKGIKRLRNTKNYLKVINIVNSIFNEKINLKIKRPLFFPKEYENLIQKVNKTKFNAFFTNFFLDLFEYYGKIKIKITYTKRICRIFRKKI